MEQIKEAIARAKKGRDKLPINALGRHAETGQVKSERMLQSAPVQTSQDHELENLIHLDRGHLEEMRIFAHDGLDRRTSHYDMLRTQVSQILKEAHLKTFAITSPRPGVGKTMTALNLAFSIARQREQSVLLVDLDLRRPRIVSYLGLRADYSIDDIINNRCTLDEAVIKPGLGHGRLSIVAASTPVSQSTELIASLRMQKLTKQLKTNQTYSMIIYDLPPMLASDDFLAFLPQADCAMIIAGVGDTTVHEIKECERLIGEDKFLGCVLNKAAVEESGDGYYG